VTASPPTADRQCHPLLQADEEDRVRSADGDRVGQGHAAC